MATLAIIIWMIVAFLFINEFIVFIGSAIDSGERFIMPKTTMGMIIIVHGIIIYPITNGIFFDLYGKFPSGELTTIENVRLALISGFIALGAFSVSSFFINQGFRQPSPMQSEDIHFSKLDPSRYNISKGKIIMFGVEVTGFISAVLGIISFYIDYLK